MGGIKTNISLFRRILTDPDFQAGKLDTGYLDRLLKSKPLDVQGEDADVAAIAAGIFAMLDPVPTVAGDGNSSLNSRNGAENRTIVPGWKRAARVEGLG